MATILILVEQTGRLGDEKSKDDHLADHAVRGRPKRYRHRVEDDESAFFRDKARRLAQWHRLQRQEPAEGDASPAR